MTRPAAFLWVAAALLAGASLWRAASIAADHLVAPFDLIYETPNLRTIELLQSGENPYDARIYARPPFWITIYPPAYHFVVSWLPASRANPFLTGRLVALCCMVLAAGTLFAVGREGAWAALLAFGVFFLVHTVASNAAFLKNDSMGLLFSALSVVCLGESRSRSRSSLILPSVLATAAFFCKQSFVAAPIAGVLFLWFNDRRRARQLAALTAATLAIGLGLAHITWGTGFWFCILGAVRNPAGWEQFAAQWLVMIRQPVFVAVLLLAAGEAARVALAGRPRALMASPYLLYLLAACAVLVATVGKAGASTNYFFETVLAALLWLVHSAGKLVIASKLPWRALGATLLLGSAAVFDLAWTPRSEVSFTNRAATATTFAGLLQVAEAIRGLGPPEPTILNLAAARLSHPLPGRICVSDPYMYSLLWRSGQLPTDSVVERIERRRFDGILAPRELAAGGYPVDVQRAVATSYEQAIDFGAFVYLVPEQGR